MRVLVTGAGGFLGRHLAAALAARGDEVVVPAGDVTRAAAFAAVPDAQVAYHLAAQSHVPSSVQDPTGTWRNNVEATLQVLEWARRARPARVVLLSSAHVYGPPQRPGPLAESHPIAPRSPYGASKAATEALGTAYGASYGLDVVRVRPFNVYGPGQGAGFLVPDILGPLAEGRAPALGDPRPRRDFTFVDDAVRFLLLAGSVPAAAGQAVNLGSGQAHSVAEVAQAGCRAASSSLAPSFREAAAPGDHNELVADITAARRLLGWSPEASLEVGLRRTWESWPRGAPQPRTRP